MVTAPTVGEVTAVVGAVASTVGARCEQSVLGYESRPVAVAWVGAPPRSDRDGGSAVDDRGRRRDRAARLAPRQRARRGAGGAAAVGRPGAAHLRVRPRGQP